VNLGGTAARPRLDSGSVTGTKWIDLLDGGGLAAIDAVLQPMQVRIVGTPETRQ
jgi:hypothetical protein